MNRFAHIIFNQQNINAFKYKTILNKNLIIQGYNCIPKTCLKNVNNLIIHNCDKNFLQNNIGLILGAKNIYFNSIYPNYIVFHELQRKVIYDKNSRIYINENYYDKYMNYIETYSQYISGSSYDNSYQIRPLISNKYNDLIINALIEDVKLV